MKKPADSFSREEEYETQDRFGLVLMDLMVLLVFAAGLGGTGPAPVEEPPQPVASNVTYWQSRTFEALHIEAPEGLRVEKVPGGFVVSVEPGAPSGDVVLRVAH